jgi:hypothetical protein
MTDTKRRIALTRKVSLADLADDWNDCYAVVILASFDEVTEIGSKDFKDMKPIDIVSWELEVVARNFVSGKIMALGVDNTSELVDMTADDLRASTQLVDKLYSVIMGISLDPKGTSKTASSTSAPSNA